MKIHFNSYQEFIESSNINHPATNILLLTDSNMLSVLDEVTQKALRKTITKAELGLFKTVKSRLLSAEYKISKRLIQLIYKGEVIGGIKINLQGVIEYSFINAIYQRCGLGIEMYRVLLSTRRFRHDFKNMTKESASLVCKLYFNTGLEEVIRINKEINARNKKEREILQSWKLL